MSNQAKALKKRVCHECGETLYCSARKIREHANICRRMKALGLITPTLVVPRDTIRAGD